MCDLVLYTLLRAGHSGLYPISCGVYELFITDPRQGPRCAVIAESGTPAPLHQFSLVMLHQSWAIKSAILRAVSDRSAHRRTRQDLVIRVLPSHGKRG